MAFILLIIGFLISLAIHESAHAIAADKLGDPTARLNGRITLNPLKHLDPVGTILPIFLMMSGSPFVFGWGKPVPFDPYNLRNPRRDSALISLAGPLSNILFAIVLSLVILALKSVGSTAIWEIQSLLASIVSLNVGWALFNLIPVHPLDGGKILVGFAPENQADEIDEFLHRYGFFIVIILIFPIFGRSAIDTILSPIHRLILSILIPSSPLI